MSAPVIVTLPHQLGLEGAKARLRGGLQRAASTVPMLTIEEERWEGDTLFFRVRAMGQVASGQVEVGADFARIEVRLPWLLARFAQAAQAAIKTRGGALLDKPK
jgi:hypothetical protein